MVRQGLAITLGGAGFLSRWAVRLLPIELCLPVLLSLAAVWFYYQLWLAPLLRWLGVPVTVEMFPYHLA